MVDPIGGFRDLREALGEMVIASSEVEESLQDGIWMLGGAQDDKEQYTVATSTLGWLVTKFEKLYNEQSANLAGSEPADALCQRLRDLSQQRNDLIHGMWTFDSGDGIARRHRVRKDGGGLMLNVQSVYADEVRDLASQFRNAGAKLWEILVRLGDLKASA